MFVRSFKKRSLYHRQSFSTYTRSIILLLIRNSLAMETTQGLSGEHSFNQLSDSWYHRFLASIDRHAQTFCTCGYVGTCVPQEPYKPQKWDRVDCVPVGTLIHFPAGNRRGILVSDALKRDFSKMSGKDDPVLEDIIASIITLNFNVCVKFFPADSLFIFYTSGLDTDSQNPRYVV
jgi:hypothetical protein